MCKYICIHSMVICKLLLVKPQCNNFMLKFPFLYEKSFVFISHPEVLDGNMHTVCLGIVLSIKTES